MTSREKYSTVLFLVIGLVILVASLILWSAGEIPLLASLTMYLAPICAFLTGFVGLFQFGKGDFTKEDRFHMMNLLIALGLVLYSVSDVALVVLSGQQGSDVFHNTASLTQSPGMLFWAIGVLGYLRASNKVLGTTDDRKLVGGMVTIPIVAVIVLTMTVISLSPVREPIEVITTAPLVAGVGVTTVALIYVLWTFRQGRLAVPLGLSLLAVFFMLVRLGTWSFVGVSLLDPYLQLLSIESYLVLGAALSMARRIEDF